MLIHLHKLAKTTPKVRAAIQASDEPASVLAERYGTSEQTVYKWRHRDSVHDRSHTPHRLQTTLTPAQEAVAVALRTTLRVSLDDLLTVVREFLNPDVSRSGLDRCLRRHGVGSLRDLEAKSPWLKHKAFKAYEPGYLHVYVKFLPQMADGTADQETADGMADQETVRGGTVSPPNAHRYLFVAIDRATRWVFVRIYSSKSAANARRFLRDLERACPMRIRTILTDNGKEFTDRLFGLRKRAATGQHEFDRLCADLGIERRMAPPQRQQTNGMVERFNGRIEEVLQSHHFCSGEELETTLHRYVGLYNRQLPQSALGSKTPLQAMEGWHDLKPELFKKQPNHLPRRDNNVVMRGIFGSVVVCAVTLAIVVGGMQVFALAALVAAAVALLVVARPEIGVAVLTFSLFISAPAVLANNYGFTSTTNLLIALLGSVVILRFLARGELGRDLLSVAFVLFLYITSLAATAIYASQPDLTFASVSETFKRGVIVLLIVALVSNWRRFQWAIGGMIAGAILVSSISVLQVSFDMYDSDFGGLGNAQVQQIAGEYVSWRLSGPLSDSNYYAQTLLLALPFGLIALRHVDNQMWRIIGIAIAAIIALAILFTFSRGAMVAAGVVLIAMIWRKRVLMLGIGVVLAVVLGLMFGYLPEGFFDRLDAARRDVAALLTGEGYITDLAVAGRLAEMLAAIYMFLDHPILGVGYGQFETLYQDTARNFGLMARGADREAHSLYLEILAERGLVGAVAFGALLAFMFHSVRRSVLALSAAGLNSEAGWAKALGLGILGFMTAAIFLHEAYPHYFWLSFGIAAALPQAASSLMTGKANFGNRADRRSS